jgi:hypothetical protein
METEEQDLPDEAVEPAGTDDEHSDAPGETGTGDREPDPERGKPAKP